MNDLLYCGTHPVSAAATQSLLAGEFRALWSPPMYRRAYPKGGDRIWLLWRASAQTAPLLLGVGLVEVTDEGKVDWTNKTAPGIVSAAKALGYGGPSNMAFQRLTEIRLGSTELSVPGAISIPIGLSTSSPAQVVELESLLESQAPRHAV